MGLEGRRLGKNSFRDDLFKLYNDADQSKICKFQLSGITTDTTRTLTVPDADGTIALTSDLTAGSLNWHTTGSGRFDGGIGIGVAPIARLLRIYGSTATLSVGLEIDNLGDADAIVRFVLDSVAKFTLGVDNSVAGDPFKIAVGSALGTNDALTIDSSGNFVIPGTIAGGIYNGVTIATDAGNMLLDDVTNSHSFWVEGDNGIAGQADGFILFGGVTPRNLTVTGGDWTIDQSVASGATPTFAADNFSDGGSNIIPTSTQETNWDNHLSNDGTDHSLLGATPGTATASLALIVDASKDIDFDGGDIIAADLTLSGDATANLFKAIVGTDYAILGVGASEDPFIQFYRGGVERGSFKVYSDDFYFINRVASDTANLIFRTRNIDRMTITGAGNVIIANTLAVTGESLFSNKVKFTQVDGNEYIDSLADGYLDYGATTGHRFNTDTTISGALIGNPAGTAGKDFIFGSSQKDDTGSSVQDERMFFDKAKGAFRAGGTPSTLWDAANVGIYSIGLGLSTKASGDNGAVSLGALTESSGGEGSIAAGYAAVASGASSIALGYDTEASGTFGATAMGRKIVVSGTTSVGIGLDNTARTLAQNNSMAIMGGLVGIGMLAPVAKLHIDQETDDAAIPTLILDQADISEGFINFIGSDRSVITGATDSLESVRVEVNGVVRRIAVYVDA